MLSHYLWIQGDWMMSVNFSCTDRSCLHNVDKSVYRNSGNRTMSYDVLCDPYIEICFRTAVLELLNRNIQPRIISNGSFSFKLVFWDWEESEFNLMSWHASRQLCLCVSWFVSHWCVSASLHSYCNMHFTSFAFFKLSFMTHELVSKKLVTLCSLLQCSCSSTLLSSWKPWYTFVFVMEPPISNNLNNTNYL